MSYISSQVSNNTNQIKILEQVLAIVLFRQLFSYFNKFKLELELTLQRHHPLLLLYFLYVVYGTLDFKLGHVNYIINDGLTQPGCSGLLGKFITFFIEVFFLNEFYI